MASVMNWVTIRSKGSGGGVGGGVRNWLLQIINLRISPCWIVGGSPCQMINNIQFQEIYHYV